MPIQNHCIDCDKPASLLYENVPYCVNHYRKEVQDAKKKEESKIN